MKRKTHTEPPTQPSQIEGKYLPRKQHTLSLFSRKTRALNKYIYYKRSVFVGDSHVLFAIVK